MTGTYDRLHKYRTRLERMKGRKEQLESDLKEANKYARTLRREIKASEEALAFIQLVAQETQEQIQMELSELVSVALASIFDDPYNLQVTFEIKRGKVEMDFQLERDGDVIDPYAVGGGVVDTISLALRFCCWAISQKEVRPIMMMDEPLKWLKGGALPEKGAEMIKEISEQLGIQVIMVSHAPELIAGADRVFDVNINKHGISEVTNGGE